jgi:hypothetical protein
MNTRKAFSVVSGLVLALAMLVPVAVRADELNQATRMTFNQPIEIPGNRILPAGSYWFQLFDAPNTHQVVQIYNADRMHLLATFLVIPTERMKTSDRTELKLINQPRNRPSALLSWFYPNRMIGHGFLYGPRQESRHSEETVVTVMTHPANSSHAPSR